MPLHFKLLVNTPSVIPGAAEAADLLRTFPSISRNRGEAYFRTGRVGPIEKDPNNPFEFSTTVQGSDLYEVLLEYEPEEGWYTECSCPVGNDCKHIYAALKGLLAENSAGQVQQLSSGTKKKPEPESASLSAALEQKLGRTLKPEERRFTSKLLEILRVTRSHRGLWGWELAELGLKLPENRWPEFTKDELTFWNYLAFSTLRLGGDIPEFMRAITDTARIEGDVLRWERSRTIEEWKRVITRASDGGFATTATAPSKCELRARFGGDSVYLEWRRAGMPKFEKLKATQARTLREDLSRDNLELTPEAAWLWEGFLPRLDTYGSIEIPYGDRNQMRRFVRFFGLPSFHTLLVNPDGEPFEVSEEMLRWNLDAAATLEDDYRLQVTRADGSPLANLLVVLHGHPALYVTHRAVFRGPAMENNAFSPEEAMTIPAPALENKAGAALLLGLQVELPPRLRERVRTTSFELVLVCLLGETYAGSNSESCFIRAKAVGPNGIAETWDGFNWEKKAEHKPATPDEIVVCDRSKLRDPRTLLAGIDARWEPYAGCWSMRVTKKFPEQFVPWFKSLPPDVKVELVGELASLTQETIAGTLKLDVTEKDIDWFDLRVVLDVADTTLTPEEIKLLLNARGGFVRLKDKGWRRLQFNLSQEEDEQLARLGLNPRALTSEPQRLHALQLADTAAKRFLAEPQFERVERRAAELKTRVTPPIPAEIRAELRPYQQDGFHFLAYLSENRFGGILADDMGLGKTLQTLTWLEWLRQRMPGAVARPTLVVCPKSVMDNWRAEVERFSPSMRVKIWSPDEMPSFKARLVESDVHVLNYNQLRSIGEGLADVHWLAVILDEGQYIKNPSSITAQIARSLRADHRLVLSGTPIENRLMDLWSLMAFAMPGILGSRAQFGKLFDAKEDPYARRRLSARVRPFLLRRTKTQVAKDLPERIEEDLLCEIEGEQKTLYRAELKRAQQMLLRVQTQKQLAKERFHFLTSLLRLRQICCDPRLVKADCKAPSAKMEALIEQLEPLMEEGQKVLIFSQFVQMLELLRQEIEPRGWPMFYLAGETENRGDLVKSFQSAEGAAVFLISLKAGGFGLNLTAASYVILFDPWWNPAVENQAIDRTHRIGQKQNVIAYRLLIKDSIEQKIRTLQKTKSSLAEDVLGEEKFAQSLSLQDLQFLFKEE